MAAIQHVGAAAPGLATPTSDNAHLAVGAVEGQGATDNLIFEQAEAHRKRLETLTSRAALLGLVLHPVAGGAWCVAAAGGAASTVQSLQAAEALVFGCELVRADVVSLAARLASSREIRA